MAGPAGGPASSGTVMRVVEQVGFFTGLGLAIVLFAAAVAGRVTAVPGVTDVVERPTVPVPASRESADETETESIG